jgi:hypothetical protein
VPYKRKVVEKFRISGSVTQKIKYKAPDAGVMVLQQPQCISQFTKFPSHYVMQLVRAISKNARFSKEQIPTFTLHLSITLFGKLTEEENITFCTRTKMEFSKTNC